MRGGDPNSKRGQVRIAFKEGGEAAALKIGASLGLPETKVRRWVRKFTEAKVPAVPDKVRSIGKTRVHWLAADRVGSVLTEGDEVSLVRWDDIPTVPEYVANHKLKPGELPVKRRRVA